MISLEGKRILLTGASGGIGKPTARLLAQLGARLVLTSRSGESLRETLGELDGEGHSSFVQNLVSREDAIETVRLSSEALSGLDAIVHLAGNHGIGSLRTIRQEPLEEMFRINVGAAVFLAQAFRSKKIEKNNPSLVFMSSVAASVGMPGVIAYSATKGALNAATRSLAAELVGDGIRVNAILAGAVKAGMTVEASKKYGTLIDSSFGGRHPLGIGGPEDLAAMTAFLVSDSSKWVTGSIIRVDGGYSVFS